MGETRNRIRQVAVAALLLLLLLTLAFAVGATYDAYTQLTIQQQQQHLLVISRAVAQNISLYLSEQLRDVEILVRTPGFLEEFQKYYDYGNIGGVKEYILSYMLSHHHQGLSRIYLLDRNGREIFRYNQYPFLQEFDESLLRMEELTAQGQTCIGTTFPIESGQYGVALVNMVYTGEGIMGAVVGIVNMDSLYEQFVLPLDADDFDSILVKDEDGTIILHTDKEWLGFHPWNELESRGADSRTDSMMQMLLQQYRQEEGTARYERCAGLNRPAVEEITAFTRMNLGRTSWYVSAAMPVESALQPVNENLGRFALLVTAILAVLIAAFLTIYILQKNRQKLKLQTRYLQDMNRTLEELHQSREQIRHYQKLQTIGVLAGGIAHEFNNLLTPIIGYCEFLKEQLGADSPYFEDVDEIHKAGVRAKEIVQQILPFSRRDTEEDAYSPVSLDAIIRDVMKMIRMIIPSTITLSERLPETGANVYGSATQLHQVFLNLCTNACQSMEKDGGELTISGGLVSADSLERGEGEDLAALYVEVTVSDTGCGMGQETMDRIFEPFFTTKEVGEGTGLGLSLVQSILDSHHGMIRVSSEAGAGSVFRVYLPVTDQPVDPDPEKIKADLPEGQPVRLLLVDDEAKVVRYLKKRLTRQGYEVHAFTESEKALAAFASAPDEWDLLIVDYTMPKQRGTVLARQVKNIRRELPVLLITGLVEKEALEMKRNKTLDGILVKPLDFDELIRMIHQMLQPG